MVEALGKGIIAGAALDVLEELHLQELDPQEYQRIIDDVYARLLMPVSQHLFHF